MEFGVGGCPPVAPGGRHGERGAQARLHRDPGRPRRVDGGRQGRPIRDPVPAHQAARAGGRPRPGQAGVDLGFCAQDHDQADA